MPPSKSNHWRYIARFWPKLSQSCLWAMRKMLQQVDLHAPKCASDFQAMGVIYLEELCLGLHPDKSRAVVNEAIHLFEKALSKGLRLASTHLAFCHFIAGNRELATAFHEEAWDTFSFLKNVNASTQSASLVFIPPRIGSWMPNSIVEHLIQHSHHAQGALELLALYHCYHSPDEYDTRRLQTLYGQNPHWILRYALGSNDESELNKLPLHYSSKTSPQSWAFTLFLAYQNAGHPIKANAYFERLSSYRLLPSRPWDGTLRYQNQDGKIRFTPAEVKNPLVRSFLCNGDFKAPQLIPATKSRASCAIVLGSNSSYHAEILSKICDTTFVFEAEEKAYTCELRNFKATPQVQVQKWQAGRTSMAHVLKADHNPTSTYLTKHSPRPVIRQYVRLDDLFNGKRIDLAILDNPANILDILIGMQNHIQAHTTTFFIRSGATPIPRIAINLLRSHRYEIRTWNKLISAYEPMALTNQVFFQIQATPMNLVQPTTHDTARITPPNRTQS